MHLVCYKIDFQREVEIIEDRKYRVDFYLRDWDIALEVEGGTSFGKSRHSRGAGFENDARKYNALALAGVKVLRFSTKMVESGEAIDTIIAAVRPGETHMNPELQVLSHHDTPCETGTDSSRSSQRI
jgi:very-short-patch-repair endonuclease